MNDLREAEAISAWLGSAAKSRCQRRTGAAFAAGVLWVFLAMPLSANTWKPSEDFLSAVRFVESSNGQNLVGDEGRSLGDFQISEAAWIDVSSQRKARGLRAYDYRHHVLVPKINRLYASEYFSLIHQQLRKKYKRPPTHAELYAAYNMGLDSFAECEFQMSQVNPVTLQKCRQITRLMIKKESEAKSKRRSSREVSLADSASPRR